MFLFIVFLFAVMLAFWFRTLRRGILWFTLRFFVFSASRAGASAFAASSSRTCRSLYKLGRKFTQPAMATKVSSARVPARLLFQIRANTATADMLLLLLLLLLLNCNRIALICLHVGLATLQMLLLFVLLLFRAVCLRSAWQNLKYRSAHPRFANTARFWVSLHIYPRELQQQHLNVVALPLACLAALLVFVSD